jgi:hypothetical protein
LALLRVLPLYAYHAYPIAHIPLREYNGADIMTAL